MNLAGAPEVDVDRLLTGAVGGHQIERESAIAVGVEDDTALVGRPAGSHVRADAVVRRAPCGPEVSALEMRAHLDNRFNQITRRRLPALAKAED